MSLAMPLKVAACSLAFGSAASAAPQRVVAADVCAESYVVTLAEQETVAAVSWQAGDIVSIAPDWALDLPRANADAERLISLNPDLVVFGPQGGGGASAFLDRAGIAHVSLIWGEDWSSILANIRIVGEALDRQEYAEGLVEQLDARRENAFDDRTRFSVFYLSVTGGAAGAGTLVDEAIRLAGARNAAAEEGATGWLAAEAEWAFRVDPDLVLTSYFVDGYATRNDIGARHNAFRRLLDGRARLDIPASAWSCAGPQFIEAVEAIATTLDEGVSRE